VTNLFAFVQRSMLAAAAFSATVLLPRVAAADVNLIEKDGWTVFINGRVQAFLNYNKGDGFPQPAIVDGNGQNVELRGGGESTDDTYLEYPLNHAATDPGKIQELRLRTGFVGNVLGFGIKKQINDNTDVLAYTAVTTYIDSTIRRKYLEVRPDWRESYLKITGPWGSLVAGRSLGLYSRGATEITYLYGFRYGLGWPGSVSSKAANGTSAGHVGFGVLGNGFAGGLAYATPSLAGAQITVGVYDANSIVGSGNWERVKWPRGETEITFERKLPGVGMFKLFGNGAWQKVYNLNSPANGTIAGVGYGGRLEVGPVHLGLAGHYGKGVGLDFALQPSPAVWDQRPEYTQNLILRNFSGYYAQAMVSATKLLDISAGAGVTMVQQTPQDRQDSKDDDMNPATNSCCDNATGAGKPNPTSPDSVGFVTIKQQLGLSAGVTVHATENIHVVFEYFRAMFEWYKATPATAATNNPTQNVDVVNAGITYAW
jgi:hypothetical protein